MRILFSEGSSLTAREFLTVLGPRGHLIDVLDPSSTCICRFSRWTRKVHPCPSSNADPVGYLEAVNRVVARHSYDVVLPTHEQAWLFSAAGSKIHKSARMAISSAASFSCVQSKIEFARLLDILGLPQPKWEIIDSIKSLATRQPPFYLKAPYSTAGSGVRLVNTEAEAVDAFRSLRQTSNEQPIMLQSVGDGEYAQVQALFDHGRLVACHTSAQTAVGIGPSAAGRLSVAHSFARDDVAIVGEYLKWHGGLTLDYLFRDKERCYIECNPRTTEPANAVASGVDLPGLQLSLSLGEHPDEAPPGRAGIRTHSSLAILLGTAAYVGTRKAVLRRAGELLFHQGAAKGSRERLTPVFQDPPSVFPLMAVAALATFSPRSARLLSESSIKRYAVTSEAIRELEEKQPSA